MRSRFGAILFGVAVLTVAIYDFVWLQGLGFPDGHLTELDRVRMPLHYVFIGLSILAGLGSLSLAVVPSVDRRRKGLFAVTVLYSAIGLTTLLIDWHLSSWYEAGTGG